MHCEQGKFRKLIHKLEQSIGKQNRFSNDGYILFENFCRMDELSITLAKMILAKGINEKTGKKIISFTPNIDEHYKELCRVFDIEYFVLKRFFKGQVKAVLYTVYALYVHNIKNSLTKLKYHDVLIGDLIYNTIIRLSNGKVLSINKICTPKQISVVYSLFSYIMLYESKMKNRKIEYYIVDETNYTYSAVARMAAKDGAKLILGSSNCNCIEIKPGKDYDFYLHQVWHQNIKKNIDRYTEDSYIEEANNYLNEIFHGKRGVVSWKAYKDKIVLEKGNMLSRLGINNKKKNIVIMAHCFTDGPLCGGEFIFKDYFSWLEETLNIVQYIDKVNWIVRPHPMNDDYGEHGVVKKLYEKFNSKNIFFMSEKFSAQMVSVIADAIVTVNGTGGLEFSCCGVPCVVVGHPYYSGFGFTIDIKSLNQYRNILGRLESIHPLSTEQVNMAKKVLHLNISECKKVNDELQEIFENIDREVWNGADEYTCNNDTIDLCIDYLNRYNFRDSYLYQFGYRFVNNVMGEDRGE